MVSSQVDSGRPDQQVKMIVGLTIVRTSFFIESVKYPSSKSQLETLISSLVNSLFTVTQAQY